MIGKICIVKSPELSSENGITNTIQTVANKHIARNLIPQRYTANLPTSLKKFQTLLELSHSGLQRISIHDTTGMNITYSQAKITFLNTFLRCAIFTKNPPTKAIIAATNIIDAILSTIDIPNGSINAL